MSRLGALTASDERPAISEPWLEIKDKALYMIATNGHLMVMIEMADYADQDAVKFGENKQISLPPDLLKKPTLIEVKGTTLPTWTDRPKVGWEGDKPDVWKIIPKMSKAKTAKGAMPVLANPVYWRDIAALAVAMFGGGARATILTFQAPPDPLTPVTFKQENSRLRLLAVLMPIRP